MIAISGVEVLVKDKDGIVRWMTDRLAAELGVRSDEVDVTVPFAALGVDSILGVSLAGELADELSIEVPATMFWDYPTIDQLAEYLAELSMGARQAA